MCSMDNRSSSIYRAYSTTARRDAVCSSVHRYTSPPPPVGRGGIRAAVFWCFRMFDGWPQLLTRQQGVTCVNSPPQVW